MSAAVFRLEETRILRIAGVIVAVVLQAGIAAASAAQAAVATVSCVATHVFSCDPDGCTREVEVSNGSVRLYLDQETGTGELCEYTQCRGIAAARFGPGPAWVGQVAFGPSSSVLNSSANGEEIDDAALLPTLGGLLGVDTATGTFLLSQQSRTTVSGYSGTCEGADAE
jgi:hypothetical protein